MPQNFGGGGFHSGFIDSGAIYVPPMSGSAQTYINAAIATQNARYAADGVARVVQLLAGTYVLGSAVTLLSGVHLRGAGRDRTIIDATAITGGVDTATNYAIGAVGTVGAVSTLLNGAYTKDDLTATVDSTTGMTAGGWLLFSGNNNTLGSALAGYESDGANVTLYSLAKISTVDSGTQVTLRAAAPCRHGDNSTVVDITPVQKCGLGGLTVTGAGGTLANGLLLRSCDDVHLDDLAFQGCARFGVECDRGTQSVRIPSLHSKGENGGLLGIVAAHRGVVGTVTCDPNGLRTHANSGSLPRGVITGLHRPTGWVFANLSLGRACQGIRWWGGWHNSFVNVHCWDLNPQTMIDRNSVGGGAGTDVPSGTFGVAWDESHNASGNTEVPINNGTVNFSTDNLSVNPSDVAALKYASAVLLHDGYDCHHTNMRIGQLTAAGAGTEVRIGLSCRDTHGYIVTGLQIVDCIWAMTIGAAFSTAEAITFRDTSIQCPSGGIGIRMQQTTASKVRFYGLAITGSSTDSWRFDDTAGTPYADYRAELRDYYSDTGSTNYAASAFIAWHDPALTALVRNNLVDLLATSGAGTTKTGLVAAASVRQAIFVDGYSIGNAVFGSGYGWYSPANPPGVTSVLCDTAAVAVGDSLENSATNGQATAVAKSLNTIGKSLDVKAAGATGRVRVVAA